MNMRHEAATTIDPFVEILAPTSSPPVTSPEDDLYGFLIGSWELDIVAYPDDGNATYSTCEAHVARVLDGRAVQDVFINPQRSERSPDSPKFGNWYGTTFRYLDPMIRAWRVFWFNPDDGVRAELVGSRRGNEIVQEGHSRTARRSAGHSARSRPTRASGAASGWNPTAKHGGSRSNSAPGASEPFRAFINMNSNAKKAELAKEIHWFLLA
jgi:hypothetical protein